MQLSKENSDAEVQQERAPGRPPAASRGQRGPGVQPSRPPAENEQPCGDPERARPALRSPGRPATSSGTRGDGGAQTANRAVGPSPRGAKHATSRGRAAPRRAPPLPAPGPRPPGGAGARSYLAEASGCHGPARPSSASGCPTRASRRLLNLQVPPRGGESMRAGAARRGRGERAGGGPRGGVVPPPRKREVFQAVFAAATATGSPRTAPDCPVIT